MSDEERDEGGVEFDSIDFGGESLTDRVASLLRGTRDDEYMNDRVMKAVAEERETVEGIEASSLAPEGQSMTSAFVRAGAIAPPWPPELLLEVYRMSNSLRQNIDAYATNIDGFGYSLQPVVDLDSDDAWDMVSDVLREELAENDQPDIDIESGEWKDLVEARIIRLKREASQEKIRLRNFFDFCGLDISLASLRKRTRRDLELFGYGGWEILKNASGGLAKFVHIPGQTLRLLPVEDRHRISTEMQRLGPFTVEEVDIPKRFRKFVHWQSTSGQMFSQAETVSPGTTVYLKEWGDDRIMSSKSGTYYPDVETLREEEPDAEPAREILYFDLHNPDSPYGEPRWLGNLLSVLGSRESEEVNYLYFRNKSIPPMVLLIAGGKVGKDEKDKIKDYIERELKGSTASFHKILIITARSDTSTGEVPKMEFKPLTDAMLNEGIFQTYDERNIDKVGSAFRLPRLLRGDIRDFNRATADAALRFTESQVFSGERDDFDFVMNRMIMTRLEARFWKFVSNPPPLRDPEAVVEMVEKLVKANVMTPAEARRELSKVGVNLDVIDEPWTKRPIVVTMSGVGFEPTEGERVVQTDDISQAPEDGEGPPRPLPSGSPEGLRALEEELFERAKAQKVSPEMIQEMNRAQILDALGDDEDENLKTILDALGKV